MWRDFLLLAICECGVTKNSKSLLIVSRDDESNFCHAWTGVFCIFCCFLFCVCFEKMFVFDWCGFCMNANGYKSYF